MVASHRQIDPVVPFVWCDTDFSRCARMPTAQPAGEFGANRHTILVRLQHSCVRRIEPHGQPQLRFQAIMRTGSERAR